jgi:hypothetical protein
MVTWPGFLSISFKYVILIGMKIKNTRHQAWTIKELNKISDENSIMAEEKISVDAVIRLAIYSLIIENRRNPLRITKEFINTKGFQARKAIGD